MNSFQQIIVSFYGLIGVIVFIKGFRETRHENNAFGLTPYLLPLGIFVWADAVVLGLFWTVSSIVCLVLKDIRLFLLIVSLFWLVRSIGEMMYWFHQQFSTLERNPPKTLRGYSIFQNDSIWFGYQLAWQCMTVTSLIFSLYFGKMWLQTV